MGGWTDPGAASVPQDSENDAVRVEGAGVEDSEGEQEGISSSENTPGQDRKPQGLGYQQKGIDSVSPGAHHQLSPQLRCSFQEARGKPTFWAIGRGAFCCSPGPGEQCQHQKSMFT